MRTEQVKQTIEEYLIHESEDSITITQNSLNESFIFQNYFLIWMDTHVNEKYEECQNRLQRLETIVKKVILCNTLENCVQYIDEFNDSKALVVLSDISNQQHISKIHDMPNVYAMYIFDSKKIEHDEWTRKWPKVEGVYNSIALVCESLRKVARQCDYDSISLSFLPKQIEAAADEHKNINELDSSFAYISLFKKTILELEEDNDKSLKDLVAYFSDIDILKSEMTSFKNSYHEKSPIWWYTYELFLHSMLDKSLRNFDIQVMMKMGFMIRNIHRQLEQLYKEQAAHNFKRTFTVYHGKSMTSQDFQHILGIGGGLITFHSFLPAKTERRLAMNLIKNNLQKYKENVGVLFVITIDPTTVKPDKTPFAQIDKYSAVLTEKEILFSITTMFRVDGIKQIDTDKKEWEVQLTIADKDDPLLTPLKQCLENESETRGWSRMVEFMLEMKDFDRVEILCNELLKSPPNHNDSAAIYRQFARLKSCQEKYQEAIAFYEKSLEFEKSKLEEDDQNLSPIYHAMAAVYNRMNEYSKALEYYQKEYQILEKTFSPTDCALATSYNNIGGVYMNMGEYEKALEYYTKAHEIKEKSLPSMHPSLAISYSNIGGVYSTMGIYQKALEYYEKALKIDENTVPLSQLSLACTYNNIGIVYSGYGDQCYSKSLSFLEKAREALETILPPTHPLVIDTIENINIVKKKA